MEMEVVPTIEVHLPAISEKEFYALFFANPDMRIEGEQDGLLIIKPPVSLWTGIQKGEIVGEL